MSCKVSTTVLDDVNDLLYVKRHHLVVLVKYCGYRRDYLAQNLTVLEEALINCGMCEGILREPCLSNEEITCLVCNNTPKQSSPVKIVENSVDRLEIKCPLLRDCKWNGNLSEAETHLEKCEHFRVECNDCQYVVIRGELNEHRLKSCPKRVIDCDYCKCKLRANDMEVHLKFCSGYPITCLNNCGEEFPRERLSDHQEECALVEVECPFRKYGCDAERMKRKDLLTHIKNFLVEHTSRSLVQLKKQESEIISLRRELEEKKMKMKCLDEVEWEMQNVDKLVNGTRLQGPTFYASNYKLQCYCKVGSVFVEFFIIRIQGEYDSNLGDASVTQCRFIIVKSRDNKSYFSDLQMNYGLVCGVSSEAINSLPRFQFRRDTPTRKNNNVLIRLYFDVKMEDMRDLDSFDHDSDTKISLGEEISFPNQHAT